MIRVLISFIVSMLIVGCVSPVPVYIPPAEGVVDNPDPGLYISHAVYPEIMSLNKVLENGKTDGVYARLQTLEKGHVLNEPENYFVNYYYALYYNYLNDTDNSLAYFIKASKFEGAEKEERIRLYENIVKLLINKEQFALGIDGINEIERNGYEKSAVMRYWEIALYYKTKDCESVNRLMSDFDIDLDSFSKSEQSNWDQFKEGCAQ